MSGQIETEEGRKFCSKCGEPLLPGQKFCKKCGKPTAIKPDNFLDVRIPKLGRRSALLIGIIAAVVLFASAGFFVIVFSVNSLNSPTMAVETYLNNLKKGQYTQAFDQIDKARVAESLNNQIFVSANTAADKKWSKISNFEVVSSNEIKSSNGTSAGDATIVTVFVKRGPAVGQNQSFYVQRSKKFWIFNTYLVVPPVGVITLDTNVEESSVTLNGNPTQARFEKKTDFDPSGEDENKRSMIVSGLPFGVYKVHLEMAGAQPLDFEADLDRESFAYAANVEPTPETLAAIDAASEAFLAAYLEAAKAKDSKLLNSTATASMVEKATGELSWHSQETSMTINDRVSCELWSPTSAKAVYSETYVMDFGGSFRYSYNIDSHSKTTYKLVKSGNTWLVDDMQRSNY